MKSTTQIAVTCSATWEYEDLAILAAEGHRARGDQAVVVQIDSYTFRVYSWSGVAAHQAELAAAANAPRVGHFYTPIKAFEGRVLKYNGIATASNSSWFIDAHPGTIILPERIADRIRANDHTDYNI